LNPPSELLGSKDREQKIPDQAQSDYQPREIAHVSKPLARAGQYPAQHEKDDRREDEREIDHS
jgi:hypothetical protein